MREQQATVEGSRLEEKQRKMLAEMLALAADIPQAMGRACVQARVRAGIEAAATAAAEPSKVPIADRTTSALMAVAAAGPWRMRKAWLALAIAKPMEGAAVEADGDNAPPVAVAAVAVEQRRHRSSCVQRQLMRATVAQRQMLPGQTLPGRSPSLLLRVQSWPRWRA